MPKKFVKRFTRKRKPSRFAKRKFSRKPGSVNEYMSNHLVTKTVSMGVSRSDRILLKLPYEQNITFTANTYLENQFNVNSLFDPDRTGVGHQPMGFDQWTTFYNRYLVYGVSYRLEFMNLSGTSAPYVGVVFNNDATSLAPSTALEQDRSINRFLSFSTGGSCRGLIKGYIANNAITGVPKSKYNSDDAYASVYTASPSEVILAHVFCMDSTVSTNVTCYVKVRLVYHCMMFDPHPLPSS